MTKTLVALQWQDGWVAEALIVKEDIQTFIQVHFPFDFTHSHASLSFFNHALLRLQHISSRRRCDASGRTSPTTGLLLGLMESSSSSSTLVPLLHLHHLHLLFAAGTQQTRRYDENKMTTETLHTVIRYEYKHYEKMSLFFFSLLYKMVKGCFGNRGFIFPPLRYEIVIVALVFFISFFVFLTVP